MSKNPICTSWRVGNPSIAKYLSILSVEGVVEVEPRVMTQGFATYPLVIFLDPRVCSFALLGSFIQVKLEDLGSITNPIFPSGLISALLSGCTSVELCVNPGIDITLDA